MCKLKCDVHIHSLLCLLQFFFEIFLLSDPTFSLETWETNVANNRASQRSRGRRDKFKRVQRPTRNRWEQQLNTFANRDSIWRFEFERQNGQNEREGRTLCLQTPVWHFGANFTRMWRTRATFSHDTCEPFANRMVAIGFVLEPWKAIAIFSDDRGSNEKRAPHR